MLMRVSGLMLVGIVFILTLFISPDFGTQFVFSQDTGRTNVETILDDSNNIDESDDDRIITDTVSHDNPNDKLNILIEEINVSPPQEPLLTDDIIDAINSITEPPSKEDINTVIDIIDKIMDRPTEEIPIAVTITNECEELCKANDENFINLKLFNSCLLECDEIKSTTPPKEVLSEECQELGADTREECKKLIDIAFIPRVCVRNGIITAKACDTFILQTTDRPDKCIHTSDEGCRKLIENNIIDAPDVSEFIENNISDKCTEKGAHTLIECARITESHLIPLYCRDAGLSTHQQCSEYIEEKGLTTDCKSKGITRIAECREYQILFQDNTPTLTQGNTPNICKDHEIQDATKCKKIVQKRALAEKCENAGIETREECNDYLVLNELSNYCSGETDFISQSSCQNELENELKKLVRCSGSESDACRERAVENHLGNWISLRQDWEIKRDELGAYQDEAINKISDLPAEVKNEIKKIFKDERPIHAYPSHGGVVISENGNLITLSPTVIFFDDDGDGLSNEFEERLGTNPQNKDSDGDGFEDRTELLNDFNPIGEGRRVSGLWPVENAMILGAPLEHPQDSTADVDETFEVNIPDNIIDETGILNLSGSADPNTLVTLYIYSSLPLVLTVETNNTGGWNYVLQESLSDGEHEIYVALLDDTGTIERRSTALSFFVKEAKAITVEDFFGIDDININNIPTTITEIPVKNLQMYYMIGGGVLVVLGLGVVFLIIQNSRKKERKIIQTIDDLPE